MTPIASQVPATESRQTVVQPEAVQFHRIREIAVCHLSPVESRRDERAFSRQSTPMVAYGVHPTILGPHSEDGQVQGVEFISISKSRSRAIRMLSASRIVRSALEQHADLYHVHSPELIPAALVLKFAFGKKVVYDTREDFPSMMLTKAYLPGRLRTLASRIVAIVERLAARSVDGFITADSGTLRPHAKAGKSRKLVFYNFPNLQYFPEPAPVNKPFDLVYRGGLSARAGTFVLLDSLRLLKDRGFPVRLLMFGYTDNQQTEQTIRKTLSALGIEE